MISVIGGGPSGSYVASLLAKDYDTTIYEEHDRIGKPIQCTGIVSKNLNEYVDLKSSTINQVKGAFLYSKNNKFELRTNKVQATIICREKFDNYVKQKAVDNGAKVLYNHRFVNHIKEGNNGLIKANFNVRTDSNNSQKQIETKYLIGADGPNSTVAKSANLLGERKNWFGAQATIKGKFDPEMVELHLGSICPGFFGWLVPENDEIARFGLACMEKPRFFFDKFMEKISKREGYMPQIVEWQGGLIPYYEKQKCQEGNVFLVGDAARQVKATTGGGIVMGIIAGEALNESIRTGKSYDKLWKKKIGRDLWMTKLIRDKIDKFDDDDYDNLIQTLNGKSGDVLSNHGDMDFPSRFVFKMLMADPRLVKYAFK